MSAQQKTRAINIVVIQLVHLNVFARMAIQKLIIHFVKRPIVSN